MRNNRPVLLALAALCPLALLGSIGCSKSGTSRASAVVQDIKRTATDVASDVKAAAVDTWDTLRELTFDRRADFTARFDRMADDMDARVAELKSRAAGLPDAAARDREAAIREYDAARADLGARMTDLGHATADTWGGAKAKVAAAWQRAEDAYDKAAR